MSEQAARTIALGGGATAPYPTPTSAAATAIGRGNRRSDTKPEVRLRSALHRAGLRFRKNYSVTTPSRRVNVDIAFPRARVAVFVDGCFWHCCPKHGTTPRSNSAYWASKLAANRKRDEATNRALRADGWTVIRVWEHEQATACVGAILATVKGADGLTAASRSGATCFKRSTDRC